MILAIVLAALLAPAAEDAVEILPLRYRTADEVLPVLQPLVEGHGAITGSGTQIFVRASPERIAQVRRLLATLDTRPRDLWISVRQSADRERTGTFGSSSRRENVRQGVRGLDGRPAEILIAREVPVHGRGAVITLGGLAIVDDVWFQTLGTGFSVVPRLLPDGFSLDIVTRHAPGGQPAGTEHELRTSVTGAPGEWIGIGHVLEEHSRRRAGLLGLLIERGREVRTEHYVEVKVAVLEN